MSDEPFFLAHNKALLPASPQDDLLHPLVNAGVAGDTLTETQYFGFNVPGESIDGLAYKWYHPNLEPNKRFHMTYTDEMRGNSVDHAGSNPQVSGKFALPAEKALNAGWIWRDNKLLLIARARKTITRHPESFIPQTITLHLTTEDGVETEATGTLVASCPWATWPNIMANISLIRWEVAGRVGCGDAQDVLWNDFVVAAGAEARDLA